MYAIKFCRDFASKNYHDRNGSIMSKDHPTLEAACKARDANGDLVIHQDTGKISAAILVCEVARF